MNWQAGDKGTLQGEGIFGVYHIEIISIDEKRNVADMKYKREHESTWGRVDYSLDHLRTHGKPLSKLHKILA